MSSFETSQNNFTYKLQKVFSIPPQDRSDYHLDEIMAATAEIGFLKKITEEKGFDRVHWECCRAMTLEIFEKDKNVVNIGEIGEKFYIILQGKVSVQIPTTKKNVKIDQKKGLQRKNTCIDQLNEKPQLNHRLLRKSTIIDFNQEPTIDSNELIEIRVLNSGDSFGELALLNNNPRSATVKCLTQCYFAVLSQRDYKKILRADAEKTVKERVNILKQIPIFKNVSESSLKCLSYILTEATYKKNQNVYVESTPADNIFIVKSGEFKLSIKDNFPLIKHQSTSSLLKLKMMKKSQKTVDLQLVVKGKHQVFGHEEFSIECSSRQSTCTCISLYGKVFLANINVSANQDVKNRAGCLEVLKALRNEKFQESSKNNDRIQTLRTVEKLKQPLSVKSVQSKTSQSIHNLLYDMGKRHRPAYVVNGDNMESKSSSPKKEKFGRIETEISMKSVGSVKSLKSLHSAQMTPRILVRSKEIVNMHEGILRNILKKGGVGGVFKETFNDFCQIGNNCMTTRANSDLIYPGVFYR